MPALLKGVASGLETLSGMIVIQLLANGILQQMVQPIAMGAGVDLTRARAPASAGGC